MIRKTPEPKERIDALQALMDRFASPDLTLAEAKVLRSRILEWIGEHEDLNPAPPPATSKGFPPPECRYFAA